MRYAKIEELISDVDREVRMDNPDDLKGPILRYFSEVADKIGKEKLSMPDCLPLTANNGFLILPEDTVQVMDVVFGWHGLTKESINDNGCLDRAYNKCFFNIFGNRISFSNTSFSGDVTVLVYRLPIDDSGVLYIDEKVYSAVLNWAIYRELKIMAASKTKAYKAVLWMDYKVEAQKMIDEARASLNRISIPEWRVIFENAKSFRN